MQTHTHLGAESFKAGVLMSLSSSSAIGECTGGAIKGMGLWPAVAALGPFRACGGSVGAASGVIVALLIFGITSGATSGSGDPRAADEGDELRDDFEAGTGGGEGAFGESVTVLDEDWNERSK
jgi:hypothetical protein